MHWNQDDLAHVMLLDRALAMRDAGDFAEAVRLLEELVAQLTTADTFLLLNARLQLGDVLHQLGRVDEAEAHVRWVLSMAPTLELASLALFRLLVPRRPVEGLKEAVRFLSLRESLGYRELLRDAYEGVSREERELAEHARTLLAKHRDAQRARVAPAAGDTVRVIATASAELRPGELASVQRVQGTLVQLQFPDGETVEAPVTLVDHRDI